MLISDLIQTVMNQTDEVMPSTQILDYLNDAIAKVNTRTSYELSFISPSEIDSEYMDLPETYQRSLLAVYASARVKENDSSITEAQHFLEDFYKNLIDFERLYVADDLEKLNVGYAENDWDTNPYIGGW